MTEAIQTKTALIKTAVDEIREDVNAADSKLGLGSITVLGNAISELLKRKVFLLEKSDEGYSTKIIFLEKKTNLPFGFQKENTNLIACHLPSELTYVDNQAFNGCTNLKYLNIPYLSLGNATLYNCSSLKGTYRIKNSTYTNVGHNTTLLSGSGVTKLIFGDPTEESILPSYCCYPACPNLEEVILINVYALGTHSLRNNKKIKTFTWEEDKIRILANYCFMSSSVYVEELNLPNLESVEGAFSLPSTAHIRNLGKITSTGNHQFINNTSIIDAVLPSTLQTIGTSFCQGCKQLEWVKILAETPPTLATNAFGGTTTCKIYVPYSEDHSILTSYKEASGWVSIADRLYELNESGEIPE